MSDHSGEQGKNRAVVIDLGKKRRKQVNDLRKGKGRLLDKVQELVGGMKAEGQLSESADTVVVIVEKKRRKTFPFSV